MKVCLAQIQPIAGNINQNTILHKQCIHSAAKQHADLIVFPELSLSGYEPKLAEQLALNRDAAQLLPFQELANLYQLVIGIGIPLKTTQGIQIAQVFLQPNAQPLFYAKQFLHEDELPYFIPGKDDVLLNIKGIRIIPAICYEALQTAHNNKAITKKANLYLALVAKPQKGVEKAYKHFAQLAFQHNLSVAMCNNVGHNDNFLSVGQSAYWNNQGERADQLETNKEQLLFFEL